MARKLLIPASREPIPDRLLALHLLRPGADAGWFGSTLRAQLNKEERDPRRKENTVDVHKLVWKWPEVP